MSDLVLAPRCGAVQVRWGRPRFRVVAALAVVSLAAYLLGQGVPQLASPDAGRIDPALVSASTDGASVPAAQAGVDVDGVVESVSHRVVPVHGRPGVLESVDGRYRATFDESGFTIEGLRVSLSSIRHGDREVNLTLGAWRAEGNAATRTIGGGLAERVTAREGEVEWDVVLDRSIAGVGDLVVEAGLAGLVGDIRRTDDALFLRTEGGDLRMGTLVVRDASGRELHRALPTTSGSTLGLVVPAAALSGAVYPVTLDPTVSPEFPVTEPGSSPAPGTQGLPAVAFDGTNHLVVWDGAGGLFAARVTSTGTVLDSPAVPIAPAFGSTGVAFGGTKYLVVWTQANDLYGVRVSTAGMLVGSPFAISTAPGNQFGPALTYDGTNFQVVWTDTRSGVDSDVYGARVSAAGTVLDPAGIPISTALDDQRDPRLAFNGINSIVVWQDERSGQRDVYASRMSKAGAALDPAGIPIESEPTSDTSPDVTFDGFNYLVVWERQGILGTRITPQGTVLDEPMSISSNIGSDPRVAFDGTNYLVVWSTGQGGTDADVAGARVTRAGIVLEPSFPIGISTAPQRQLVPAISWGAGKHLVVWEDWRATGPPPHPGGPVVDIYGARVSPAGTVLDPAGIPVALAANDQSDPVVAFDGTNFLVVWADRRSGRLDIYGARVTPTGDILDGTGIPIATGDKEQRDPAVLFDGTNYLVAWEDYRDFGGSFIFAVRVSVGGAVLGPSAQIVGDLPPPNFEPKLASDGTNSLVVWADDGDVLGRRVSPAGTLVGGQITISPAAETQVEPAVAWNGSHYFVVWREARSSGNSDIYGTRVGADGAVLDPAGIAISTASQNQLRPGIAWNGLRHLVVWEDERGGTGSDIYGARVTDSGIVEDPNGFVISTAADEQQSPQLAVNGPFMVVWQDRRSGSSWDVYGARVTKEGDLIDADGIPIATSSIDELNPAVATGVAGANRFGIVYDRDAPEPQYAANRVFLRTYSK